MVVVSINHFNAQSHVGLCIQYKVNIVSTVINLQF